MLQLIKKIPVFPGLKFDMEYQLIAKAKRF